MKRLIKFILGTLEFFGLTFLVHYLLIDEFAEWSQPFIRLVCAYVVVLTVFWIVIFIYHVYKKELGDAIDDGVKFRADKIRTPQVDLSDSDSKDVYSNFERAEFAPKNKGTYDVKIRSFPESFEKPKAEVAPTTVVVAKKEEVKKETVKEMKVEQPKKEKKVEVVEQPKKETKKEKKVEEPKKEKKVEEPKKEVKLIGLNKVDTVEFSFFDGQTEQVTLGWFNLLKKLKADKEIQSNLEIIKKAYEEPDKQIVYPEKENLLKPFELTDISNVRVVIIGKLPHYRRNQADGLAFSSAKGTTVNQATNIIIKEAMEDVKIKQPKDGSFIGWAKKGVFLFNTILTAPNDKPASHSELWVKFANAIIKELANAKQPKVFILWGEYAQSFKGIIAKNPENFILEAPNPSPLSAASGFYGTKHFSKANEYLVSKGFEPIDWNL